MSLSNVMAVSASALSAQSVWLNSIASNLANAEVVTGSEETAYRARQPVFAAVLDQFSKSDAATVTVAGVERSQRPVLKEFAPQHSAADEDGYIYHSNVNPVEEMANMMAASRAYQNSVETMNTAKQLLIQTLGIGR